MKSFKLYLFSILGVIIFGGIIFLVIKFDILAPPNEEYFLNVNLSAETRAELELRREENFKRLELFPNTYEVYIDLGNIERLLGNASQAIEYYHHAWELIPSNSTPWINSGNIYIELGLYNKAEEAFLRAKEINSIYPLNYLNLAELYEKYLPEKSNLIRGIYLEGLAATDNHPDLLIPFAEYLYENGDYSEALLYYQELVKQFPDRQDFEEMIDLINQLKQNN